MSEDVAGIEKSFILDQSDSLVSFLHVNQRCVATLGEMIHTASLIHDDVVDSSDRRRGKPAAAVQWGPKKVSDERIEISRELGSFFLGSISWRLHSRYIIGVACTDRQ